MVDASSDASSTGAVANLASETFKVYGNCGMCKRKIEGAMERDLKEITSVAYKKAQEIKGKADAEATLIYAEAYGRDPGFYSFVETLNVYREAIGKDSSLVLSTDSELLRYFKDYGGERSSAR